MQRVRPSCLVTRLRPPQLLPLILARYVQQKTNVWQLFGTLYMYTSPLTEQLVVVKLPERVEMTPFGKAVPAEPGVRYIIASGQQECIQCNAIVAAAQFVGQSFDGICDFLGHGQSVNAKMCLAQVCDGYHCIRFHLCHVANKNKLSSLNCATPTGSCFTKLPRICQQLVLPRLRRIPNATFSVSPVPYLSLLSWVEPVALPTRFNVSHATLLDLFF